MALNSGTLSRWQTSADLAEIPKEGYQPEVKIFSDPTGKSDYTFGIILNSYRYQRPQGAMPDCPLCDVLFEIKENPDRNLDPEGKLKGYTVMPNKFPLIKGTSMAVHSGTGEEERQMFTTSDLTDLEEDLGNLVDYTKSTGFELHHNSDGLGASITRHEHWHLTNYDEVFDLAGERYGFQAAEYSPTSNSREVETMPNFPFAHLIFNQDDAERIVSFLRKMGQEIGSRYEKGNVPQGVCQGQGRLLVVPTRDYQKKSYGSGETAGHIVVKTQEDFDSMDYSSCVAKLSQRLFAKDEINLENFL